MPLHSLLLPFLLAFPLQDGLPNKHLSPAPDKARVFAKVNGKTVTAADMEPYLWDWRAYEVAQDLISYEMISQEARKQAVTVSEKEIEDALAAQLQQAAAAAAQEKKTPETYMLERGFTKNRIYLRLKTDLLLAKIAEKGFRQDSFVKISTILVRPVSEQATAVVDAIKQADQAYQRLQKGETWDAVLQSVNPDPQVIQTKGLIGWRAIDAFPPSVQAEIRTLGAGKVTKPVQTTNGIQIFRIEALGKDLGADELASLRQVYMDSARRQIMDRLRSETKIERFFGPPGSY